MIRDMPKFSPPAGATPNELAATGPGSSAASEWQLARSDTLELERAAHEEAEAQRRVVDADRFGPVHTLFTAHARHLQQASATAPEVGTGVGVLAGAVWLASRWDGENVEDLLRRVAYGGGLCAVGGHVGGRLYERVYGLLCAAVPPELPIDAEACLLAKLGRDAPEWRIQGWRATWAAYARDYTLGFPLHSATVLSLPLLAALLGAPSLEALMRAEALIATRSPMQVLAQTLTTR